MRMISSLSVAAAMMALGAASAGPSVPGEPPAAPGSTKYSRRSGSNPVSGGGAKERARRLARMIWDECGEHIGHCECHVTPA